MPPPMKPQETGRPFAPEYETKLTLVPINTDEWTHVVRAHFGEGRPCGFSDTKWTGDSYQYDIFTKGTGHNAQVALRWWNGGGEGWLTCEDKSRRGESNLLRTIAKIENEAERWDACHFLWQTAHKTALAASRDTAHEYRKAFVEGRLKKKKKRGQEAYTVTIEEPKREAA